jgi:MFS family permease
MTGTGAARHKTRHKGVPATSPGSRGPDVQCGILRPAVKQVLTLALAQCFSATGSTVVVLLGGILGTTLAPTPVLATLPVSLLVVGVACNTLPAALVMQRFGRKRGFIASAFAACTATVLASWAVAHASFVTLCVATTLIGANMAFSVQYRFAATEFVPPALAARAVGIVMVGTLVAAWMGPTLALQTRHLIAAAEFSGSFLSTGALYLIAAAVLASLPDAGRAERPASGGRPLRTIAAQPAYRVAIVASLVSYATMSFIMTATPISMHVLDHHSVDATGTVIKSHLLAMYLPSIASGWLIARLGPRSMMLAGVGIMAACVALAAAGSHAVVHYGFALVLLGAGWNLLFVAATTLLTLSYRPEERFRAQGFNDLLTFGCQATVSLLAGLAISRIGWERVNLATAPLLALVPFLILRNWRALRA